MTKRDTEALLQNHDRLQRENTTIRRICELLVRVEDGCGGNTCNIGGGLCGDCGVYRLKLMARLRELLGMTP